MSINYAEFYITNVCNLSCNNCNRFNNFTFKGSQKWEDLESSYATWAKLVSLKSAAIIGGEPFTNADLPNWILGIKKLWPQINLSVTTNGTKLKSSKDVINLMRVNKVNLRVSIHFRNFYNEIIESLNQILIHPYTKKSIYLSHHLESWKQTYNAIKSETWPECNSPHEFDNLSEVIRKECDEVFNFSKEKFDTYEASTIITDATGFVVELNWYLHFHESAIKYKDKTLSLYNSDPNKAVNICDQKFCHAFKDGKLYKCGVAHALPDAIKQFNIPVTDHQKDLLRQYKPAEASWQKEDLEKYLDNLTNGKMISLCAFCPESYTNVPLGDVSKKKY